MAKRFGLVKRDAEYNSGRGRLLATVLQETPIYEEALREIYVEKMDVENAKKVLSMVQSGEIEVVAVPRSQEYSPFSPHPRQNRAPRCAETHRADEGDYGRCEGEAELWGSAARMPLQGRLRWNQARAKPSRENKVP